MKPFLRPMSWLSVSALHVWGGFSSGTEVTMSAVFSVILPSVSGLDGLYKCAQDWSRGAEPIPSPAALPHISFFGQGCSGTTAFEWLKESSYHFKCLLSLGSGGGPQNGWRELRALSEASLVELLKRRLYSLFLCRFLKIWEMSPGSGQALLSVTRTTAGFLENLMRCMGSEKRGRPVWEVQGPCRV